MQNTQQDDNVISSKVNESVAYLDSIITPRPVNSKQQSQQQQRTNATATERAGV